MNAAKPSGAEKHVDVVVVGGGGAGLAAACEAAKSGADVLIVEKQGVLGGTTAMAVGTLMAAGTRLQHRAGVIDAAANHAADLERVCQSFGIGDDAALRRLLTDNAADTVAYFESIGVNFVGPLPQPPHVISRLHMAMPTARAFVFALQREMRRLDVGVWLGTRVLSLIKDGDRAAGIIACRGTQLTRVYARDGVVLASGDVGGDPALMSNYMKTWSHGIDVYNAANSGEGHKMAVAAGACIVPRKDLGLETAAHLRFLPPRPTLLRNLPPYSAVTKLMVSAFKRLPARLMRPVIMRFITGTLGPDRGVYEQGAVLVNTAGERFGDELTPEINVRLPSQPRGLAYLVFDGRFAEKFSRWPHFISTAPGIGFAYVEDYRKSRPDLFNVAPTIEALAARMAFSPDKLRGALESAGPGRGKAAAPDRGPYYALGPLKLWLLAAPIGLAVNTRLECLDREGKAIPGLYAAGSVGLGGFTITGHGHGLGWAFTSGRLAARSIMMRRAQRARSRAPATESQPAR